MHQALGPFPMVGENNLLEGGTSERIKCIEKVCHECSLLMRELKEGMHSVKKSSNIK